MNSHSPSPAAAEHRAGERQRAAGRATIKNRRAASHEFPFTVSPAARRAIPIEFPPAAIDNLGEIAAEAAVAEIFAVGDDIAMIGAAVPFIAAPDLTAETVVIGANGIAAILAVHVARDGVAREPPEKGAANDGAAIAMTDRPAEHTAGEGAQDRAAG